MLRELLPCMNKDINSTLTYRLAPYINYNEARLINVESLFFIFSSFFVPPIPNNTVLLTGQRHDTAQTESQELQP